MGFVLNRAHDLATCIYIHSNHPETKPHAAKMSQQHTVNLQLKNPKASYSVPKTPMEVIPCSSFRRGRKAQGTVTVEVEPPFPHSFPGNRIDPGTGSEPPFLESRIDQENAAKQIESPFPHPNPGDRIDPDSSSTQVELPFPHPFASNMDGEVISAARKLPDEAKCDIEAKEKPNPGQDVTGTGRTSSSVRGDVRHKVHYYANPNKAGEYNHISGFLTPDQEQLNKIVQNVDEVSLRVRKVSDRLGELRKQICDHAMF